MALIFKIYTSEAAIQPVGVLLLLFVDSPVEKK